MFFRKLLILAYLGGVLAAAGAVLFFVESHEGSLVVAEALTALLEERTGLTVTVGRVEVNTLAAQVEVTDLALSGPGAPRLAGFEAARFALAPLQLLSGTVTVEALDLDRPHLDLTIRDGRVVGLPELPPSGGGGGGGRLSERLFFRMFVKQFRMVGLDVRVRVDGRHPVTVRLEDLRAALTQRGAELHDGNFSLGAGTITFPNGRVAHLGSLRGAASLQGEGLLRPEQLSIANAHVDLDDIHGDMGGTVRFAPLSTGLIPAADLMVAAHVPLAQFYTWFPEALLPLEGSVDFEAHWRSAFGGRNPGASGSGELRNIAVNEFVIGNWTGSFVGDLTGVEFTDVRSDYASADIRGAGRVDFAKDFREVTVKMAAEGSHASFAEGMRNIRVPGSWVEFNIDAQVAFEGTLYPEVRFEGTGDATLSNFRLFSESYLTATDEDLMMQVATVTGQSKMAFDLTHFAFVDGTITDGKSVIGGNVYLPFAIDRDFIVDAKAEVFDCASISPIGPVHLTCRGPGRALVKGLYVDPKITGTGSFKDVSVQGYQLGEAAGAFDYDRLLLRFLDVHGRRKTTDWDGTAVLNWRGYLGEKPDGTPFGRPVTKRETLHVSVHAPRVAGKAEDLRGIIPPGWGPVMEYLRTVPVNGDVVGQADARGFVGDGTVEDLTFEADFTTGALDVYEQRFDHGRADVAMDLTHATFNAVELWRGRSRWTAEGTLARKDSAVRVDAHIQDMPLALVDAMRGVKAPLEGSFDAEINARGFVGDWQGPVRLDLHGVKVGQLPVGSGGLDLMMGGGRIKGQGPLFDDRVRLAYDMRLEPPWAFNATVDADRGPAQDLLGPDVVPKGVTLTLGAHATAAGTLSEASRTHGEVTLGNVALTYKEVALRGEGDVRFRYAGDQVSLQRMVLMTDDGSRAELKGNASASVLDLDLDLQSDLTLSRWFVQSVREAYGPITLHLSITGPPSEPVLVGQGRMEGGHLVVDGFRHAFNKLDTNIAFVRDRVLLDPLTFSLDDSPVRGRAEIQLRQLAIQNITLNVRFQDLRFRVPEYLPSRLTGSLTMTGDGRDMLVTGDVDVLEARYLDPWDWERLTVEFRRRRLAPKVYDKDKEWLTFDVHLRADDRIYVRNGTMDAEFRGDLQLTGTNERVGLVGTLTGLGGRATYRNNVFELGRTTVDFTERSRVAVNVDVEAQTRIKGYDIWAEVKGPVEQLSAERGIRLWSRPDLPAVDVLSLVLLGFTQGDLSAQGTGSSTAVAAAGGLDFLSRATGVDKALKRALPKQVVDEVYLTSRTPRRAAGAAQGSVPAVVVGTELFPGTRLRFTSTLLDPAGNQTDQAVELEQRWTKHFSGQLSWSRSSSLSQYGDAGADVRYRWQF